MNSSIFDLHHDLNELESINGGMAKASYHQVPPSRDCTTTNFTNGQISFKFQNSGTQWWIPAQSFVRLRVKLTKFNGNALVAGDNIASNMSLASCLFRSAELRINDKTVSRISDFLPQIDALETRLNKSKAWIDSVGASTNTWSDVVKRKVKNVALSEFEITWTPPLSIYKIDHALPAGKYELVLNPQSSTALQKYAIESTDADKDPAADFKFTVQDIYCYNKIVEGPRVDSTSYLLDLEQTTCYSEKVGNTNLEQKNFDVSPATYALTCAYQDLRAGTNTMIPPTQFHVYNTAVNALQEPLLNRWFISYAGQNYPQPDADPATGTRKDFTTQRYVESMIHSNGYHDTGGAETIEEWNERGQFHHVQVAKDGADRSTKVVVNSQFDSTHADVDNMRLLLFSHSKQVARVQIVDGRVVDVIVQDV